MWGLREQLYCLCVYDNGPAVRIVTKWYEFDHGKIITIALGDALNDLPMLNEADYPILVHGRKRHA